MKTSFEQSIQTTIHRLKDFFRKNKYAYLASPEDPDWFRVEKTWDVYLFAPLPIVYDGEESAKDAKERTRGRP